MRLTFEISGNQIDGGRDYQEDAFLSSFLDSADGDGKSSALVVMADGMGGHAAGNIASNLVVSTFTKTYSGAFTDDGDVPNSLRAALAKANGALSESIRETSALNGMGCTMVAAVFHLGKCWWISVGDSHLYLVRDRELAKKNEDHSYGRYLDSMSAHGMDVEPESGLSRNTLMSAMTGDDIAEIDCPNSALQLLPGDRLIVASDGLDTLSEGTIIQMCVWSNSAKECVEALLRAVEDEGKPRQDNTTVIILDVHSKEEEPALVPARREAPPPPPGPRDNQPLHLADMEQALAEDGSSRAHRDRDIEADDDDGDEGSILRVIVIIAMALLVLGGLGGAAWWYVLGGDKASAPAPIAAPQPSPEPIPQPTSGPITQPEPKPAPAVTLTGPAELKDQLSDGSDGPELIGLEPGSYRMGSNLFDRPDETPQRTVSVDGFAIGKYEITQAEYVKFAEATSRKVPRSAGGDPAKTPVVNVRWDDARAYTRWLSQQSGAEYRLPSEAEWEYAASGGNGLPYWWGYKPEPGRAHCINCQGEFQTKSPAPIGSFKPNPFGLFDTAGNVLEWVHDCYHQNYSGAPGDSSVFDGGDCSKRVARGGAFNTPSTSMRNQRRTPFQSTRPRTNIGFRVARDL